jgi:hypothetical protein
MGDLNSRLNGLNEIGYNAKFLLPTIGLVIILIIFFIAVAIMKKARGKNRSDMMAGITYLDVTGMNKQGLLTPEEMARVRAAMSRQLERQRGGPAIKAPASLAGELALMADPEVQQLEALAEQKAKARTAGGITMQAAERSSAQPPPMPEQQSAERTITGPASQENFGDPIPPDYGLEPVNPPQFEASPQLDASAWTRPASPSPASDDDVQLPADVVKMAELGLITSEELEKIKQRIRDKKRGLQ